MLRTLTALVETARAAGVPISICGDMAGDPFLTWVLVGLGFRQLSMDRDRIPLVKAIVRGSSGAGLRYEMFASVTCQPLSDFLK